MSVYGNIIKENNNLSYSNNDISLVTESLNIYSDLFDSIICNEDTIILNEGFKDKIIGKIKKAIDFIIGKIQDAINIIKNAIEVIKIDGGIIKFIHNYLPKRYIDIHVVIEEEYNKIHDYLDKKITNCYNATNYILNAKEEDLDLTEFYNKFNNGNEFNFKNEKEDVKDIIHDTDYVGLRSILGKDVSKYIEKQNFYKLEISTLKQQSQYFKAIKSAAKSDILNKENNENAFIKLLVNIVDFAIYCVSSEINVLVKMAEYQQMQIHDLAKVVKKNKK